jgi:hypothetical protein
MVSENSVRPGFVAEIAILVVSAEREFALSDASREYKPSEILSNEHLPIESVCRTAMFMADEGWSVESPSVETRYMVTVAPSIGR